MKRARLNCITSGHTSTQQSLPQPRTKRTHAKNHPGWPHAQPMSHMARLSCPCLAHSTGNFLPTTTRSSRRLHSDRSPHAYDSRLHCLPPLSRAQRWPCAPDRSAAQTSSVSSGRGLMPHCSGSLTAEVLFRFAHWSSSYCRTETDVHRKCGQTGQVPPPRPRWPPESAR